MIVLKLHEVIIKTVLIFFFSLTEIMLNQLGYESMSEIFLPCPDPDIQWSRIQSTLK